MYVTGTTTGSRDTQTSRQVVTYGGQQSQTSKEPAYFTAKASHIKLKQVGSIHVIAILHRKVIMLFIKCSRQRAQHVKFWFTNAYFKSSLRRLFDAELEFRGKQLDTIDQLSTLRITKRINYLRVLKELLHGVLER